MYTYIYCVHLFEGWHSNFLITGKASLIQLVGSLIAIMGLLAGVMYTSMSDWARVEMNAASWFMRQKQARMSTWMYASILR